MKIKVLSLIAFVVLGTLFVSCNNENKLQNMVKKCENCTSYYADVITTTSKYKFIDNWTWEKRSDGYIRYMYETSPEIDKSYKIETDGILYYYHYDFSKKGYMKYTIENESTNYGNFNKYDLSFFDYNKSNKSYELKKSADAGTFTSIRWYISNNNLMLCETSVVGDDEMTWTYRFKEFNKTYNLSAPTNIINE